MPEVLLHDVTNSLDAATTAFARDHSTTTTTALPPSSTTLRMRTSHPLSILPRVGGGSKEYEGRMRKRFNWRLIGFGVVLIFVVVWVLGPRERRERVFEVVGTYPRPAPSSHFDVDDIQQTPPVSIPPKPQAGPPSQPEPQPKPLPKPPPLGKSSFDTDPDPSKTIHCTTPYHPSLSLVQWALMIDAGSMGSRIHIYKFHNCFATPQFEYEVFRNTEPGLSEFAGDPDGASGSLDVLMDEALRVVPVEMRRCTPVAVKATAGLRLLGADESTTILEAVRGRLNAKYPFRVLAKDKDGVAIMDGKDEGVFAWITVNYLLSLEQPQVVSSHAVLDLGGASTQFVFEPNLAAPDAALAEGDHKYHLVFGGRERVLYQHSYLGYGLKRARKSVHRLVDFMHREMKGGTGDIANPCLSRGTRKEVDLDGVGKVNMVGADVGSFEACRRIVDLVLAKDAVCPTKPCSFNGVYQPSLLDTFPGGEVILLSYFYDRLAPLLPASGTIAAPTLNISSIATMASNVCLGRTSWDKHWGTSAAVASATAMEELEGRPEYCLDLTYMYALLRVGYEFEDVREVSLAKKVGDTELGWSLGATIAMLEGGVECIA